VYLSPWDLEREKDDSEEWACQVGEREGSAGRGGGCPARGPAPRPSRFGAGEGVWLCVPEKWRTGGAGPKEGGVECLGSLRRRGEIGVGWEE